MGARNQVVATGRLLECEPVRYTPAGVAAVEFRLEHESTQGEAGGERRVQCVFTCICLGKRVAALADMAQGTEIAVNGFLAARSRRWPNSLVLHVTEWKAVLPATTPVN